MEPQLRNKLIIAGSIGVAIVAGIFIKNKIQENRFTPLPRDKVLEVLRKSKKENYRFLKNVAGMALQIGQQMKLSPIDPNMVKQYLESPESPLKIVEIFQENCTNICKASGTTCTNRIYLDDDFNRSLQFYSKNEDRQIISLAEQIEKDYEMSLSGKIPQFKVNVPANLTKERIIEINKKIVLKKYLIQVDMLRRIRGKSEAELASIMEGMPNPDEEQEKIFEEEGLGNNEEPATAVFYSAMAQYRNDAGFKDTLQKIESGYMNIFEKYKSKLQQNRMTENDLNELEDDLIYSQQI